MKSKPTNRVVICNVTMIEPNTNDETTECDNVTALELQRTKRVLYFSDGCTEEFSDDGEEDTADIDITDKSMEVDINVKTLPLLPRIKYQAYQVGSKVLYGIDYVGVGLANFLGITTPKFVCESDIDAMYQEKMHEKESGVDTNATWNNENNNAPNTVITRYPSNVVNNYP